MSTGALSTKSVLVCVTGGVAAYKTANLVSQLVQLGAHVQVAMSAGALQFLRPLTFQALTGRAVITDLFDPAHGGVQHVDFAGAHDIIVVAPTSANMLAKLATGTADGVVPATILSSDAPILIAPAMESTMWEKPPTQRNVARLRADGMRIIEPSSGRLASGAVGVGRMAEPDAIAEHVRHTLATQGDLVDRRILVTAGGTWEPLDPVRALTNRSSGAMGLAAAVAARDRGAQVTLITTTVVNPRPGIEVARVQTAEELAAAVKALLPDKDVLIMAAAVADFRPATPATSKIKKDARASLSVELERTQDILAAVGTDTEWSRPKVVVGFAAETEQLVARARDKARRKNLDLIAANLVRDDGRPFGVTDVHLSIVALSGEVETLPEMPKPQAAHRLLDRVVVLLEVPATTRSNG